MPFCTECGAFAPEGAKFCGACGKSLFMAGNAAPAQPAAAPASAPAPAPAPTAEPLSAPPQNIWPQAPAVPAAEPQSAPPQNVWPQAPIPAPAPSAPAAPAAPVQNTWAQTAPAAGANSAGKDFSAVTVRYRCPNGHVFDGSDRDAVCRTCGAALEKGGHIHLYRMGNFMGAAVGMGIYIDGVPHGHIANRQSLRISVPYGSHKIHVTHTATRKCNDPVYTVTPEAPTVYCKAHFTKATFAIAVDEASPADMPER